MNTATTHLAYKMATATAVYNMTKLSSHVYSNYLITIIFILSEVQPR